MDPIETNKNLETYLRFGYKSEKLGSILAFLFYFILTLIY